MHVFGIKLDLNSFLQIVFTVLVLAFGLLHLVKNTASKYFDIHANFDGATEDAPMPLVENNNCFVCGKPGSKKCSRCKSVRYCSQECQSRDWSAGHKNKCRKVDLSLPVNGGVKAPARLAVAPVNGGSQVIKQTKKILFPYDEFVHFFNWDTSGFSPCGLLNCGNSCFANVVLQCLSFTRPLVAYLLEKGHRRECKRNDWCFLCEFQVHVERASQSPHPFSPINILSRLPNIGGNLGYGRQEDAHEFMRFAIDTMQSVCLDEFGGERAVHPSSQETTLIQHIFGGHLQSQVVCTNCKKVSNQYENMMDLTVEIHGDASSLEECLNQFTAKEWLDGDNMYKCDGCNDYVKAWKRLTVQTAPNILTIALKRFQSGRFGKLNKKVSFPETLDLSPYMSEAGDGTDIYKLYAVVVHLDMLNASFFGHYICYAKDFCGNWYRIDDCKVKTVSLEEVLSQGAYMLLYSRVSARPSCLKASEHFDGVENGKETVKVEPSLKERAEKPSLTERAENFVVSPTCYSKPLSSDSLRNPKFSLCEKELSIKDNSETTGEVEQADVVASNSNSSLPHESSGQENDSFLVHNSTASMMEVSAGMDASNTGTNSTILYQNSGQEEQSAVPNNPGPVGGPWKMTINESASSASLSMDCSSEEDPDIARANLEDTDFINSKSTTDAIKNLEVYGNGHATAEYIDMPVEEAENIISSPFISSDEASAKIKNMKQEMHRIQSIEDENGVTRN